MAGQLESAFQNGVSFDASAIYGFETPEKSDLFLHPDPTTLSVLPWRPTAGKVVRMFCTISHPDGTPYKKACFLLMSVARFQELCEKRSRVVRTALELRMELYADVELSFNFDSADSCCSSVEEKLNPQYSFWYSLLCTDCEFTVVQISGILVAEFFVHDIAERFSGGEIPKVFQKHRDVLVFRVGERHISYNYERNVPVNAPAYGRVRGCPRVLWECAQCDSGDGKNPYNFCRDLDLCFMVSVSSNVLQQKIKDCI